jgi:RNA-directed DNA polymerase
LKQGQSYDISKKILWDAYQLVRKNAGAAGIDNETLEKFGQNEKNNLYKLWARMSSGSYFPKSVRRVEIPKKDGGMRALGIPTVTDRIAQMTARLYLEPMLEPHFHPDSYGYRPQKSAHQAVEVTRKRCWEYDWVIDLDIKGFFDTIDHDLMLKAVDHHNPPAWIRLYIERWLKASVEDEQGKVHRRDIGTPQGGVISPLLANLFLHYTFDIWMARKYPQNPFARYADDIVVHCRTNEEAERLLHGITQRFAECKLTVHPIKTKIVYCKDANREQAYPEQRFDFLGFTFRPRFAKNKNGQYFVSFSPAISKKAEKGIKDTIRSWRIHTWTGSDMNRLVHELNPRVRGWLTYYGQFRRSALSDICRVFQKCLEKWAKNKYRALKGKWWKARALLRKIAQGNPKLFAHWEFGWCYDGI